MGSDDFWKRKAGVGWIPPISWTNREAPRCLSVRYGGERNFDRTLLMGSSTKPLWATAILAVHPNLDKQLKVRGPGGEENDVFGINITPGWDVRGSDAWVDFKRYLAASDNRYHIRLGFLGLAEKAGGDVVGIGSSNSVKESLGLSGGEPWSKFPQFPLKIGFSNSNSNVLLNLQDTELAHFLKSMYSIGVGKKDFTGRMSFWTKNEADDVQNDSSVLGKGTTRIFRWISPEASEFGFDQFSSDSKARKGPRDFVTMLLGGGSNLWSNVDFAAAFGTCITGNPVIAHIVKNRDPVNPLKERMMFPDIAAKVRPGLAAVITEGTAFRTLQKTSMGKSALALLKAYPKSEVYAKTGTLKSEEGARNTSRIVLAIVKWKDKNKGLVESGLVFSVVAERAQVGKATEWLAEFLLNYRADIEKFL
jgi:cell division protein FtsI/penicillin-binding protein 2